MLIFFSFLYVSLSLFFFFKFTGRVVDLGLSAVYVDPFIYLRKDFNSSPLGSLCTPVKRHTIGSLTTLCYCWAWIFHQQQYSLPQRDWPEICNQPWAASLVPQTAGWMRFSLKPLSALSLSTFPTASVAHHPTSIIYSLIHLLFGYVPRMAAGARAGSKRDKVPFLMELMF